MLQLSHSEQRRESSTEESRMEMHGNADKRKQSSVYMNFSEGFYVSR